MHGELNAKEIAEARRAGKTGRRADGSPVVAAVGLGPRYARENGREVLTGEEIGRVGKGRRGTRDQGPGTRREAPVPGARSPVPAGGSRISWARRAVREAARRADAERAAFLALCRPTSDPCDVAHLVRRTPEGAAGVPEAELLVPARELRPEERAAARPRRYHPSQLVGRPGREVGIDSMFDRSSAIADRLARQGVETGWGNGATRRDGAGAPGRASTTEETLRVLAARMGPERLRSALRGKTTGGDDGVDADHEAAVRAFLAGTATAEEG